MTLVQVICLSIFLLIGFTSLEYHACQVESWLCFNKSVPWLHLDHIAAPLVMFIAFAIGHVYELRRRAAMFKVVVTPIADDPQTAK